MRNLYLSQPRVKRFLFAQLDHNGSEPGPYYSGSGHLRFATRDETQGQCTLARNLTGFGSLRLRNGDNPTGRVWSDRRLLTNCETDD
ncbi:hypothetical protein J2R76_002541 [Bradyrhizobium sp. USDA 4532]|nr:hypothetical protein [Bradyrhizobium sp. USDA 4545]MCP1918950.1 hypothetical protein [Bradyrhizobium sp. USDA 4532]